MWDVGKNTEIRDFVGHEGSVSSVGFAPDNVRAISASQDKSIRVWDLSNGKTLDRFETHSGYDLCMAVVRDGRRVLLGGDDKKLRLWRLGQAIGDEK